MVLLVRFWRDEEGDKPVGRYMRELPSVERAKLAAALAVVQEHGLDACNTRHIEGRLWGLKVDAQRAFHVLVDGPELVVLHAYRKKSQRAPQGGIAIARARMRQELAAEKSHKR